MAGEGESRCVTMRSCPEVHVARVVRPLVGGLHGTCPAPELSMALWRRLQPLRHLLPRAHGSAGWPSCRDSKHHLCVMCLVSQCSAAHSVVTLISLRRSPYVDPEDRTREDLTVLRDHKELGFLRSSYSHELGLFVWNYSDRV